MLFGLDINEVIAAVGVAGVAAIIFAESGLMIGFFLPGDTLLFATGFLTQQSVITMNIHLVVVILWIAAVAGDNVGYTFGKHMGPRIFAKKDSLLFHQDNLQKAERFYERFGVTTIILARFVPMVRTFAPIVAGVGKMPYRKFLGFDLIGGALWAGGVTYVGYFGGSFLEAHGIEVDHLILPIIGTAMLLTIGSPLIHILKDRDSRRMFFNKIRTAFKQNKPSAKDK